MAFNHMSVKRSPRTAEPPRRARRQQQHYWHLVKTVLQEKMGLAVGRYPYYGTREAHLAHVLSVHRPTVCLDVGGHHGEFGGELRAIGYAGRIVSFEPASSAYSLLAQRARKDNCWGARQLALGSSPGVEELHIFASTDFNSFRAMTDAGRERTSAKGSEQVVVERLDTLWPSIVGPDDRAFLKVDTQGSDIEVLRGAGERMSQVTILQVEAAVNRPLYDGSPDVPEVIEFARSCGMGLSGVFPVASSEDGTELVEVDCLFVRAHRYGVNAEDAETSTPAGGRFD